MPYSSFQEKRIKKPNHHQICEPISARLDIQQQATTESEKSREKLSITESLIRRRLTLLIEARKAFRFFNVWTLNGAVYCIHHNKRQVLNDFGDIDKLILNE